MIETLLFFTMSLGNPATDLINSAKTNMDEGRLEIAVEQFEKALRSGDLNDYATIIAYWNLHAAYDRLNKDDNAAEALLYFIINSETLIEYVSSTNNPVHPAYLFMEDINLNNRLKYAKSLMEIYWIKHNPNNCRTKESACILPMNNLLALYQFRIPFCGDKDDIVSTERNETDNILNIKVKCKDSEENYYFR